MATILVSGLGGVFDFINALPFYFALKDAGHKVYLGSIRTREIRKTWPTAQTFAYSGCLISGDDQPAFPNDQPAFPNDQPAFPNDQPSRYCESKVASQLETTVVYFARSFQERTDIISLKRAISEFHYMKNIDHSLFIDGGGNSLILQNEDYSEHSEKPKTVFDSRQAITLQALASTHDNYLGIISAGLGIKMNRFNLNLLSLNLRHAYHGSQNLRSNRITMDFPHPIIFTTDSLKKYFRLAEQILPLHKTQNGETPSCSATVFYHALKGNYGILQTFVRGNSTKYSTSATRPLATSEKSVNVTPDHHTLYLVNASAVHPLKCQFNRE